jgi:hypothetical protein
MTSSKSKMMKPEREAMMSSHQQMDPPKTTKEIDNMRLKNRC